MGKIAVIGAGPAGLTAAYQLSSQGKDVTLYEASDSVGGMAKSFELWGQTVDLGPHRFFSNDPRINKFWLDAVDRNYVMVDRLTRIYYRKKFFDYPLKAFNALLNLGLFQALLCVLSYLKAKIKPIKDESTFENWVVNRFGRRLFNIFFKSYTEKLWGLSCSELDADFAAQRIKKLDLYEAIKAAIFGGGGNKHKTLVDQFAYPVQGAGEVYYKLAEKFVAAGGELHLSTPVDSIVQTKNTLDGAEQTVFEVTLSNGHVTKFDQVISTMPITKLVSSITASPEVLESAKNLKFRNTIAVYLELDGASPFPDQWIYVHSPDLISGRITNFSNWTPSINNEKSETILCLEFWCNDNDPMWQFDDDSLISVAVRDLESTGLNAGIEVKNGYVVRIPKCYPIYENGYRKHLEIVEDYLKTIDNLYVIGRYGSFKYNNQDHSILMGLLAADSILTGNQHNLWNINTDYEYQESSTITASGLVSN